MGGPKLKGRSWKNHEVTHFFITLAAALIPVLLIMYVLRDVFGARPSTLIPNSEGYRDGIDRICGASDDLVTIALTVLGATVVWFLKNPKKSFLGHILIYSVFVLCVISLYLGVKLSYTAGITLAGADPDIVPLLELIGAQMLLALGAGLILSAVVIFSTLQEAAKR